MQHSNGGLAEAGSAPAPSQLTFFTDDTEYHDIPFEHGHRQENIADNIVSFIRPSPPGIERILPTDSQLEPGQPMPRTTSQASVPRSGSYFYGCPLTLRPMFYGHTVTNDLQGGADRSESAAVKDRSPSREAEGLAPSWALLHVDDRAVAVRHHVVALVSEAVGI